MAWRRPGDKPLSEAMMLSLLTHICVAWPQWLKSTNKCAMSPPQPVTTIKHYGDVIMCAIASQITSLTIVYSTVYSDADQGKHQSSASLAFVRRIHRGPVNSPYKWPVTRKMFPFHDVIMNYEKCHGWDSIATVVTIWYTPQSCLYNQ